MSALKSVHKRPIQTEGPYDSLNIYSIIPGGNKVFAGTNHGLHGTNSIPGKWDIYVNKKIWACSKKGNILYFGGLNSGIYYLEVSQPKLKPDSLGLQYITINAISCSDTCLFASTEFGGFHKFISSEYTKKWESFNVGLPLDSVQYYNGNIEYIWHVYSIEQNTNTVFSGTQNGVYKADAGKLIWYPANNGLPPEKVQFLKIIQDTVFTGINNEIFYSADNGDSWNIITPHLNYAYQEYYQQLCSLNDTIFLSVVSENPVGLYYIFFSPDEGQPGDD